MVKERGGRVRARARVRATLKFCERKGGGGGGERLSRELSTPVGFIHRFAPATGSVSMKA